LASKTTEPVMGIEETTREQLLLLQEARSASAISEVEYRGALRAMVEARWSIGSRPGPAALPSLVETLARAVVTELRNPESDEIVRRSPDGTTVAAHLTGLLTRHLPGVDRSELHRQLAEAQEMYPDLVRARSLPTTFGSRASKRRAVVFGRDALEALVGEVSDGPR